MPFNITTLKLLPVLLKGSGKADEEEAVEMEVRPAPGNEVIKGEVIGNGENEDKRRAKARAWDRGLRRAPEQMENPASLPEFRARIFIVLGEEREREYLGEF